MHTPIPVFFEDLLDFAHCQYTHLHQNWQVSDGTRQCHYFKKQPSDVALLTADLLPLGSTHRLSSTQLVPDTAK